MRISIAIAVMILFLVGIMPAQALAQEIPQLPDSYWGTVEIYTDSKQSDAPVGTVIVAEVDGEAKGSITVTESGKYGGPPYSYLLVQGDIPEGSLIEFYVNGIKADQSSSFKSGGIEELPLTVHVSPPEAQLSAEPTYAPEGTPIQFTVLSTGGMPPITYEWRFGDGNTSTNENPLYEYPRAGTYSVDLTVNDWIGNTVTIAKKEYITIYVRVDFEGEPRSGYEWDSANNKPLVASFTDTSISVDRITSWVWDFGDGSLPVSWTTRPLDGKVSHTYQQNGTYSVSLTITEDDGDVATKMKENFITVLDTTPNAEFTAVPTSGYEPLTVSFTDTSTSYDGIVLWVWDFGDGSDSVQWTSRPQDGGVSHTYQQNGTYTMSLRVEEADGDYDIEAEEIIVGEMAPNAEFTSEPTSGYEPLTVEFTDTSTSYDGIVLWVWDFGDGSASVQWTGRPQDGKISHIYQQNGTYTMLLRVEEADGSYSLETEEIAVWDTEPDASFTAALLSGDEPLTVEFTDTSTSYDGIVLWVWDFGDGSASVQWTSRPQDGKISHLYKNDGSYTVSLTVTEADNDSNSETKTVLVQIPPAGFNRWVIIAPVIGIVIIGLLIYFWLRRRRASRGESSPKISLSD